MERLVLHFAGWSYVFSFFLFIAVVLLKIIAKKTPAAAAVAKNSDGDIVDHWVIFHDLDFGFENIVLF